MINNIRRFAALHLPLLCKGAGRGLTGLFFLFLLTGFHAFAQDIPARPNPPMLVNDMAHMLTESEQNQLERKLEDISNKTSTQITIVTVNDLGGADVSEYAIKLGKAWGVGQSGKNNGVVMLVSLTDHKINISTGKGLEGALTDLQCGLIIRNEIEPAFKEKNYYEGLSKAADAVIASTKGEYKGNGAQQRSKHVPFTAVILAIIVIIFIIRMMGRGGGGSSGGGIGNFATGMLLGNMLGGGFGGDRGGDGDGGGGGGFGGFGGGDFGGGGASGSW